MSEEAVKAYEALSRMALELQNTLDSNEYVGASGVGPNAREFFVQSLECADGLVRILGETAGGEFEQLIFAPDQISLRLFSIQSDGARQAIGFSAD